MHKKKQMEYYEALLEEHGPNYLALDWNSPESQKLRYGILKEVFVYAKKTSDISLLDNGCGLGDLFGYFRDQGLINRHKIRYTGYDISAKMISAARKKYPEARFEVRDILEESLIPAFDYVFCSGVFNIRTLDIEGHLEWVKDTLQRMFDLCKIGLAVNFLSQGLLPLADPEGINSGRYFQFVPEEIIWMMRHLTDQFILRHDYHPGDFTVYLLK